MGFASSCSSSKSTTALPSGPSVRATESPSRRSSAPLMISVAWAPRLVMVTLRLSWRLRFTSTQTLGPGTACLPLAPGSAAPTAPSASSAPSGRRHQPSTSSPLEMGRTLPAVSTGRAWRSWITLRYIVRQSWSPPAPPPSPQGKGPRLYGSDRPSMPTSSP